MSGSFDNTIRLWDAQRGTSIGNLFCGHDEAVRCAMVSNEGNVIVSGSHDNTIRQWDGQSRVLIGDPISGHGVGVH